MISFLLIIWIDGAKSMFVACLILVLTASVMGDHCSPISDTTIMSSNTSAVDHMDHVSTQMPYALTVGLIAAL